MATAVRAIQDSAAHLAESHSAKHRLVCRVGFAAHGVVYLLVGAFALDAALSAGRAEGATGAISTIGRGPLGSLLLTVLAGGLLAYAYLRVWQGVWNPEGFDADASGWTRRAGRVVSGLVQVGLALYALSIAFGWFAIALPSGSMGPTARLMSLPAGRWVVGGVGLGFAMAGAGQFGKVWNASFLDELRLGEAGRRWVKPLGRAAFAARGTVMLLTAAFIAWAAWRFDPAAAEGLGGALRTLQRQAFGPWLLGGVALGLIAFAVIRGVYARFAVLRDRQPRARADA